MKQGTIAHTRCNICVPTMPRQCAAVHTTLQGQVLVLFGNSRDYYWTIIYRVLLNLHYAVSWLVSMCGTPHTSSLKYRGSGLAASANIKYAVFFQDSTSDVRHSMTPAIKVTATVTMLRN